MKFTSFLIAAVSAAVLLVAMLVLLSLSLPKKGEFEVDPEQRSPRTLKLQDTDCKIAKYYFDDLYSDEYRLGCEIDSDCIEVLHPIGCETVIASKHRNVYDSKFEYIKNAKDRSDSTCSLPITKCRYGESSTTCDNGMCKQVFSGR